jgi:electron transfer flavoprotein beta subunit
VKIIVLVKQVPDTWSDRVIDATSGRLDRGASDPVIDEIGERAVEVALQYQDSAEAEVVALTMGPAGATDVLRKALAMGADRAIHVVDDALVGADLVLTAHALAAAIVREGFDLVVAGNESTDGRGGVLPAMLAQLLGAEQATWLDSVEVRSDGVSGTRATDAGSVTLAAGLPAVISVTVGSVEPRFPNFKGIMRAKKKPLATVSASELALDVASASRVIAVTPRPARTAGVRISDDGTAAAQLADFLAAQRLL